jgi:hypothetical protein
LHGSQGSVTGRKPLPVRPGMFLETVTKVPVLIDTMSFKDFEGMYCLVKNRTKREEKRMNNWF